MPTTDSTPVKHRRTRKLVPLETILGNRYGALVALEADPKTRLVTCRCDCGRTCQIYAARLVRETSVGRPRSCGCNATQPRHGHTTHTGHSHTYSCWSAMKSRCSNPNSAQYPYYGGRGIRLWWAWGNFACFLRDMGIAPSPKHTLERIDNDRGYEPGNVRWATMSEQQRNKRNSRYLTFKEQTKTLADWCDELGLNRRRVRSRLDRGWDAERALTAPFIPRQDRWKLRKNFSNAR